MGELLLARHGETEWSLNGRHTGTSDIPLTENGRRHARNLAARLEGRRFALVLTSPLQRAIDTCKLAGLGDQGTGPRRPPRVGLRRLRGDHERARSTRRGPDWSLWRDGCPNGEQAADVGARADRLIAEARATEGDVIFFGHGHMLRVIGARWVDLPPEDGGLLGLGTGALCTLGYEHDLPILVHWNEPGG